MEVSIIVPIYNVEKYIIECLDSVLKQGLKDFEILCIDDCGSDASIKKVEQYIRQNKMQDTIKIVKHEMNKGLSSARNTGIEWARGEYCYFLDGDDLLKPDALSAMYSIAQSDNLDILEGSFEEFYETDYNIKTGTKFNVMSTEVMAGTDFLAWGLKVKEYIPMACAKLYKTKLLKESSGFMPGLISEDEEFTPRIYLRASRVSRCNICSYLYRRRDGSITTSYNNKKWIDSYIIIAKQLKKMLENQDINRETEKYILQRRAQIILSLLKNIAAYNVETKISDYAIEKIKQEKLRLIPIFSPFFKEKVEGILFICPRFYMFLYRRMKYVKEKI